MTFYVSPKDDFYCGGIEKLWRLIIILIVDRSIELFHLSSSSYQRWRPFRKLYLFWLLGSPGCTTETVWHGRWTTREGCRNKIYTLTDELWKVGWWLRMVEWLLGGRRITSRGKLVSRSRSPSYNTSLRVYLPQLSATSSGPLYSSRVINSYFWRTFSCELFLLIIVKKTMLSVILGSDQIKDILNTYLRIVILFYSFSWTAKLKLFLFWNKQIGRRFW